MDSFNRNSAVLYICLGISFIYLPGYIAWKMNWYKRKSLNSLNSGVIWDFYYPFDKHPRLYISIFRWDLQIVISGKFHNSQDSWTVFIIYKSLLWVFLLAFQALKFKAFILLASCIAHQLFNQIPVIDSISRLVRIWLQALLLWTFLQLLLLQALML